MTLSMALQRLQAWWNRPIHIRIKHVSNRRWRELNYRKDGQDYDPWDWIWRA